VDAALDGAGAAGLTKRAAEDQGASLQPAYGVPLPKTDPGGRHAAVAKATLTASARQAAPDAGRGADSEAQTALEGSGSASLVAALRGPETKDPAAEEAAAKGEAPPPIAASVTLQASLGAPTGAAILLAPAADF
jgi:hypothetical protein